MAPNQEIETRLGLWAENHAIELLQTVQPYGDWYVGFHHRTQEILTALPKHENHPLTEATGNEPMTANG